MVNIQERFVIKSGYDGARTVCILQYNNDKTWKNRKLGLSTTNFAA